MPLVHELLQLGVSVNKPSKDGETPLWIAARRGHQKVCAALVAAGAAVNHQCALGETPLMKAAESGHTPCVQLLCSAPPLHVHAHPLRRCMAYACTACVCAHGTRRCVELLLREGKADTQIVDAGGGTALMAARGGSSGDGDVYHGRDCAGCVAALEAISARSSSETFLDETPTAPTAS